MAVMGKETLLVCVLLIVQLVNGALYGTITTGGFNQDVIETAEIDITNGDYSVLAKNFEYVGQGLPEVQTSCFDNEHQIYYFVTFDYPDIIFVVDIANQIALPSIVTNATAVTSLEWDANNTQLLLAGNFEDKATQQSSYVLIAIPYGGGPAVTLLNYTLLNFTQASSTAYNPLTGKYYFLYTQVESINYVLGWFSLNAPMDMAFAKLNCTETGINFLPGDFFFFDPIANKIVGFAQAEDGVIPDDYVVYVEITGTSLNQCNTHILQIGGLMLGATYDPTTGTLYADLFTDEDGMLIFDTATLEYNFVTLNAPLPTSVSGLQVSYTL